MDYLSEAFKQLEILNEDVFDLDKDGLEDLKDFQDEDEEEVIDVIDPEAETEEELEDSYIGKVILDCSVCHTDIYKDKEDVIIDEETQLANVGEECPYCFSIDGFKVIGEVKPFVETEFETEDDVDVEVDGEEVEEDEDEEVDDEEVEKNESFKRHKKMIESISRRNRKSLTEAPVYSLEPRYDARKSFYGKAQVDTGDKGDKNKLYSYGTLVAEMKDGKPVVYGTYSATTLRHIKDWLKQNGFRADTSKQIVADYGVKDEACTGKDCAIKPRKSIDEGIFGGNLPDVVMVVKHGNKDTWTPMACIKDKKNMSLMQKRKKEYLNDFNDAEVKFISGKEAKKLDKKFNTNGIDVLDESLNELFGKKEKPAAVLIVRHGKGNWDALSCVKDRKNIRMLQDHQKEYMNKFDDAEAKIVSWDDAKKINKKLTIDDLHIFDESCGNRKPRKMKESKVPMMISKKALKEGWRGTPVKIVSHGSWGDPDLVWNNGEEEYTFNYWDIEDAMWNMFLEETGHKDSESNDPKVEEEFNEYVQDNYEGYLEDVIWGGYFDEGSTNWHDRYKRESLRNRKSRKIKESIEDIKIDTGDQEITVSAKEKEDVESDGEMIAPISDETKDEIETNSEETEEENGEEVDVDMDEFSEEEFDDLGESYLKKVYENVDSYKTTSVSEKGNKLKVEGLIKFTSGKTKKTSFVFEAKTIDKNGHAKFLGENLQISRGHKSFKLSGTISNNKFIAESLNYNYRAKTGKSSQRVYGTVKVNKK